MREDSAKRNTPADLSQQHIIVQAGDAAVGCASAQHGRLRITVIVLDCALIKIIWHNCGEGLQAQSLSGPVVQALQAYARAVSGCKRMRSAFDIRSNQPRALVGLLTVVLL